LGLGLDLGFRDNSNCFRDVNKYISNDQDCKKFLAINIDKKCKDLMNFPAVTLQALS
jgi:hypothetical protein